MACHVISSDCECEGFRQELGGQFLDERRPTGALVSVRLRDSAYLLLAREGGKGTGTWSGRVGLNGDEWCTY